MHTSSWQLMLRRNWRRQPAQTTRQLLDEKQKALELTSANAEEVRTTEVAVAMASVSAAACAEERAAAVAAARRRWEEEHSGELQAVRDWLHPRRGRHLARAVHLPRRAEAA